MATMASICLGFSDLSFNASRDEHYPNWLQRSFGVCGSYWFLTAVAWQGDAMRFWLEVYNEAFKEKPPRRDLSIAAT
jgi:hypothetical protein